jgi:hypothetical protein
MRPLIKGIMRRQKRSDHLRVLRRENCDIPGAKLVQVEEELLHLHLVMLDVLGHHVHIST